MLQLFHKNNEKSSQSMRHISSAHGINAHKLAAGLRQAVLLTIFVCLADKIQQDKHSIYFIGGKFFISLHVGTDACALPPGINFPRWILMDYGQTRGGSVDYAEGRFFQWFPIKLMIFLLMSTASLLD